PVNVTTVSDAVTDCESVAVTLTLVSTDGAKARQISDVPCCTLVRCTRTQVKPPPLILLTTGLAAVLRLVATNASNSSLAAVVEKAAVARVVAAPVAVVKII